MKKPKIIQMFASVIEDEKLRRLLRQQAKELRDKALKKEQEQKVSAQEKTSPNIESLEELSKILQLCETTRVRLIHDIWLVGIVVVLIVLIVGGLLHFKVRNTEIELDISVTELEFTLSKPMLLLDTLHLSELGIFELQEVQLPRSQEQEKQILQPSGDSLGLAIKFSAFEENIPEDEKKTSKNEEKTPENFITLTTLLLPPNSTVRLRCAEVPNTYRLIITASEKDAMDIQMSVNGKIYVKQSGAAGIDEQFEFPSKIRANTIDIEPVSDELIFDLKLFGNLSRGFVPLIPSRNFDFTRIEEFGKNTPNPYTRRVSSILSGKLSIKELNNKQYRLQYGDNIRIEGFDGIIRMLKLEQEKISLALHGNVEEMKTGPGAKKASLMPSWFEYWQARRALSLLWGTSVSLFGFVFIVLRWWIKIS